MRANTLLNGGRYNKFTEFMKDCQDFFIGGYQFSVVSFVKAIYYNSQPSDVKLDYTFLVADAFPFNGWRAGLKPRYKANQH